eukprot:XP_011679385.1 PREDICTED: uncharacterized protein LOC105445490 [Strongylocentrotus purpuratus]
MLGSRVIILGDFNVHVDKAHLPTPRQFLESVTSSGFSQLVEEPTHDGDHTLDLVITKTGDDIVCNYNVIDKGMSDHFVVRCNLNIQTPPSSTDRVLIKSRNYRQIDSEKFLADLSSRFADFPESDVNDMLTSLYGAVQGVLNQHCPETTRRRKQRPCAPWYDDSVMGICRAIAGIMHYLLTAYCISMILEGTLLHRKASRTHKAPAKGWVILLCVWGIPCVMIAVLMGSVIDGYGGECACWLNVQYGTMWIWLAEVCLVVAVNTVLLSLIMRTFISLKANTKKSETDRLKKRVNADKIFITDVVDSKIFVGENSGFDFHGEDIREIPLSGVEAPTGIDYDYRTDKIYWSDEDASTINRASLDGSNQEILVEGIGCFF